MAAMLTAWVPKGAVSVLTNPVSGYSLIEASNLEDALSKAKACPILKAGGSVEVAQAMDM